MDFTITPTLNLQPNPGSENGDEDEQDEDALHLNARPAKAYVRLTPLLREGSAVVNGKFEGSLKEVN